VKGKLRTVTKTKTVALASGNYSLGAGTSQTLNLTLSASSEKLVQAAKGARLRVTTTAKVSSGTVQTGILTLVGSKPKAKHR